MTKEVGVVQEEKEVAVLILADLQILSPSPTLQFYIKITMADEQAPEVANDVVTKRLDSCNASLGRLLWSRGGKGGGGQLMEGLFLAHEESG